MTNATANKPQTQPSDERPSIDQELTPTLPIDSYDGTDENDDAIAELKTEGTLEEDESLNDGNSAFSDHASNGPKPKHLSETN